MNKASARQEGVRKPRKCPGCGKAPVATIIWGLPAFDKEMQRDLEAGRVTIGGCCLSFDDPAWECTHCGLKIFRKQ